MRLENSKLPPTLITKAHLILKVLKNIKHIVVFSEEEISDESIMMAECALDYLRTVQFESTTLKQVISKIRHTIGIFKDLYKKLNMTYIPTNLSTAILYAIRGKIWALNDEVMPKLSVSLIL
jgi:hypothetical protein